MSSPPDCHYHPQQKITHFCLNQCTLPLCDICLIQHRKEDKSGECHRKIIGYDRAQKLALEIVQAEKSAATQNLEKFDNKYRNFKAEVLGLVQKLLNNIYEKTKQSECHLGKTLDNISQKMQKVKENDIKQIILVYLNLHKDPEPTLSIAYKLNEESIRSELQSLIEIKKDDKQIRSQLKKRQIIEQLKALESLNLSQFQIPSTTKLDLKQNKELKLEESRSQQLGKEKKRHRGIFVASSPRGRENYFSYSLSSKGNMKESLQILGNEGVNNSFKLEREPKKLQIQADLEVDDRERVSASQVSQRRQPATTTAKYSNSRPSSFGFPEKIIVFKESASRKRLEVKTPMSTDRQRERVKESESERKRKEVESVINRCDIASNSSSSRLIIKKHKVYQECLNPQEMRELIMKKNTRKSRQLGGSKILSDKLNLQSQTGKAQNR